MSQSARIKPGPAQTLAALSINWVASLEWVYRLVQEDKGDVVPLYGDTVSVVRIRNAQNRSNRNPESSKAMLRSLRCESI